MLVTEAVFLGVALAGLLSSSSSSGSSGSSSRSSYSDWEYERRLTETTTYTEETWYEEETTETEKQTMTFGTGPEKIDLWSFTYEIPKMVGEYIDLHPEFGEKYTVECTIIATDGGAYQTALDNALAAGGDTAPDIYAAEEAFILKYTKGDMAQFASTYKDLGIDVDKKIKEADIAKYSVDIGTRDGKVVALGYQSTGSVMIYNAEVAKDVFGTDDPAEIEKIVGAGSGSWDKFFKAAEQLKEKGYVAVSGPYDIWKACEKSADTPWVVDGELKIDPKREKYLDIAKTLSDNGYSNGAQQWSEPWYTDMKGEGEHKVFAYFGPMWLIQYVMIGNSGYWSKEGESTYGQWRVCAPPVGFFWGGTWLLANKDTDQKEGVAELIEWITLDTSETGLQYLWANGLVDWDNDPDTTTAKDTVTSAVVMAKSDGSLDFCGGQNVFPAFIAGNKYASAKAMTQYDETINGYWTDYVNKYVDGTYSREEAIEEFKKAVKDNITF
jgi:ABC-type glycerol-3-phosphate transport system substrate-binding protein